MTLPELKKTLGELGLPIAYYCFAVGNVPQLPYLVYYVDEDTGFMADDTVYMDGCAVTIEQYTEEKDLELEGRIKALLTENNIPYKSYEHHLDSENMFLKAYEINI